MPKLGDYIGQLMSEIAMARMQADLETIRIAELYASHPLLRHMPVPHLRLPDVDLDIPVLVNEAQPPREGESPRGGVGREELRKKFEDVLKTHLDRSGVRLAAGTLAKLGKALDARHTSPTLPAEMSVDVHRAADEFTNAATNVLKDVQARPLTGSAPLASIDEEELKRDVRLAFLQMRSAPPRLDVVVNSAAIREGATGDNVARIRLKITEHGVEWSTIHANGESRDMLVPE